MSDQPTLVKCTVDICTARTPIGIPAALWTCDTIGRPFCPAHPVDTACRICGHDKGANRILCRPCATGEEPDPDAASQSRTTPDNPAGGGDTADNPALAAGSCPGVELNPNPCTCTCEGCRHHCGAHQPVAARRTLTDLREQYAAAIREVCGEGPWEVIVQRSTDAIMAIHDDDMDATEDEMERRGRVITGLQAQLQKAQAALPDRAQAAIRELQRQVEVRDEQLAEARAELALLHEGEDPYADERIVPTPAQWIWLWNRAAPEERLDRAERNLARIAADRDRLNGLGHQYLSTGCLHGEHAYCQSNTGSNGQKIPGKCKFCDARCQCPCHQEPS